MDDTEFQTVGQITAPHRFDLLPLAVEKFEQAVALERVQAEKAVACYREAIDMDPRLYSAHNNLAIMLARQGLLNEALTQVEAGIAVRLDHWPLYYNRGLILMQLGQLPRARMALLQASSCDSRQTQVWTTLGILDLKLGDAADARSMFTRALATDPVSVTALHGLGKCLMMAREFDQAIFLLQKAQAREPRRPALYYDLAVAHAADHHLVEASRYLQRLQEHDPQGLWQERAQRLIQAFDLPVDLPPEFTLTEPPFKTNLPVLAVM